MASTPHVSAVQRVFGTSELLEKILVNLSTRQLFGVRRTSPTFNTAIKDTQSLQRAMYLQGLGDTDFSTNADPRLNTLLLHDLILYGDQAFGIEYELDTSESEGSCRSNQKGTGEKFVRVLKIWYKKCVAFDPDPTTRRPVGGGNGATVESWRHTRVTQASPAIVELWTGWDLPGEAPRRQATFDENVTLGDLVDKLLSTNAAEPEKPEW
ncbi:hypothetical protein PRZ48_012095 [Zasmidium cellare]|uniref:F-box domain-containing protein n=1 Tax=Zasmidium cellare TaxID=395010 RepID=A0ABR0E4F4_ZASCE|nr:hypothetical protein PRZ48_012095 [Zasmidium cellare]